MKRILTLLLVVVMLGSMLVACQTTTTPPTDDSKPADSSSGNQSGNESNNGESRSEVVSGSVNENDTDENGYPLDSLPDNLDYGGQKVSVLGWKESQNNIWPTEPNTKAPIQDISYWHKKSVEDRFHITFDTVYVASDWAEQATFMTAARVEDSAYDMINTFSCWPPILAQEGRLANLRNLEYPELDMPWWPESAEEWTIDDSLYFLGSNSSVAKLRVLHVIFAHTQMIAEEGLPNPVKSVLRGSWTLEEMGTYVKTFAGLAEANPGEAYGFWFTHWYYPEAMYYAAFSNVRKTADGSMKIAYDNEETLNLISDYLDEILNIFRGPEAGIGYSNAFIPMEEEKAALVGSVLSNIQRMEDTAAYTPVPYPKWTESQDGYRVLASEFMDLWCIPISSQNKELGGMLMEAIASSEYRTVAPFYYEQYLKKRYGSDADGMKCFDIIRQSIIYDFGRSLFGIYYNKSTTQLESMWRYCFWTVGDSTGVKRLENTFITRYNEVIQKQRTLFATVLEDYKNNNQK